MRGIMGRFGAGAFAALLVLGTVAPGGEKDKAEKVPLDKVPPAVMKAIKDRFPGADVTAVEKEKEEGKIVYDVELKHKGRKYEMDIHEDGTVIEIEKEVAAKDLPEAVAKALAVKYPKATVKDIMEVNKVKGKQETPIHYEVTLQIADNKTLEVIASLDGTSIRTEKEAKEKK